MTNDDKGAGADGMRPGGDQLGARELRVIVVEDHEIARRGLQEMIGSLTFVKSAGSVRSLEDARGLLHEHPADLLLVNSEVSAADLTGILSEVDHRLRVLVLVRNA